MKPLSIRAKVILVNLLLLTIPLTGLFYVRQMEVFLKEVLQTNINESASGLAKTLSELTGFFPKNNATSEELKTQLSVYPLTETVHIDGYDDDWKGVFSQARLFHSQHDFQLILGRKHNQLLGLLKVKDEHIVYGQPEHLPVRYDGDAILFYIRDKRNQLKTYAIKLTAPGRVIAEDVTKNQTPRFEIRFQGVWQEVPGGYNFEFKLPIDLVGSRFGVRLSDVDIEGAKVDLMSKTADVKTYPIFMPAPQLEGVIQSIGSREGRRVWIIDKTARVLAVSGSLHRPYDGAWVNPLLNFFLPFPDQNKLGFNEGQAVNNSEIVQQTLKGGAQSEWRRVDESLSVFAAGVPVIDEKGDTVGVVLVEEATTSIQNVKRKALSYLINATLFVFVIGGFVLFWFAKRLSDRIITLRDDMEAAIDSHGRVVQQIARSKTEDEIGDLNRSFAHMLSRLDQYNQYLEKLTSRLAHELKTPIAVVQSSLHNLMPVLTSEQQKALAARADEGASRLINILNRMKEATSLEQSIQFSEKETVSVKQLISQCVQGYQVNWPDKQFETILPNAPAECECVPELLVQMLDKLIDNAVDFASPDTQIMISLRDKKSSLRLQVHNQGACLNEGNQQHLFDAMVSMRAREHGSDHLGLGLYMVKLIVEHHNGKVLAKNNAEGTGVIFTVIIPKRT